MSRIKIAKGIADFVPFAVNFSQVEKWAGGYVENIEETEFLNQSDDGLERIRLENNMAYEELVVQILYNLEKTEKLVFVFQLLRDDGLQIDHGSFAKTMGITRRRYGLILENVRVKVSLLTIGYARSKEIRGTNKN